MKKTVLITLLAGISFGVAAQQQGFVSPTGKGYSQGGFSGPTPGLTSVSQAKTFRDDSWVVLEGSITRQVSHELYEFRDASGTVYVDIDDKHWLAEKQADLSGLELELNQVRAELAAL